MLKRILHLLLLVLIILSCQANQLITVNEGDTMAFRTFTLKDKTSLTAKPNSPVATIDLKLLLPVDFPLANVADSVKGYIYEDFFDKAVPGSDPEALLKDVRDKYFKNYKSNNAEIYQEGDASFNYEKVQETRIIYNSKGILTIENYSYGFTGGAHGMALSGFRVIDLENGRQLSLDDIFRADYQAELKEIINSAARKEYKLESGQSLLEAGFFSESIDPGTNFYVTGSGIGFYYNVYEVAPYAMGEVNLFVDFGELGHILAPGSAVSRLITE
jgi:hypothetical protein